MIKFFRGSGVGPVFLLTITALALWAEYFISPAGLLPAYTVQPMPVWGFVTQALSGSPLLAVLISFTLVLIVAIVMVRFNIAIFFIPRRTYLPSLLYIILFSLFPGEMILNPALPAALLMVAGLWRMISAYRISGMAFNFFDGALLISSAGLIYASSLWFITLVIIAALILRTPDAREITVAITGALLPWIIMYAVWYITGGSVSDLTGIISHNLFDHGPSVYWSRTSIILMIVVGLNFLPAIFLLVREMSTYKIRSRKTYELFMWMMVICIVVLALVPAASVELVAVAALPVSFIMANYMALTRRLTTAEILFWLMLIMIIVSRLWPY